MHPLTEPANLHLTADHIKITAGSHETVIKASPCVKET